VKKGSRSEPEVYDAVEVVPSAVRTISCSNCGKLNRITPSATKAYCGACSAVIELPSNTSTPSPRAASGSPTVEATQRASSSNTAATWGMWLGIVSIFLGPSIGLLPISTIVLSGIGLLKVKERGCGKGKAVVGLILGFLFTLAYLNNYGYLGKL
jgi:hypothetical protein